MTCTGYKYSLWNDRVYGMLNDGTLFWIYVFSSDCSLSRSTVDKKLQNVCAEFNVDINGFKRPNTFGKDMFSFYLTKSAVVPKGTRYDDINFADNCIENNKGNSGGGCAGWVLLNENMDYLHCDGLSWDGKHSCK